MIDQLGLYGPREVDMQSVDGSEAFKVLPIVEKKSFTFCDVASASTTETLFRNNSLISLLFDFYPKISFSTFQLFSYDHGQLKKCSYYKKIPSFLNKFIHFISKCITNIAHRIDNPLRRTSERFVEFQNKRQFQPQSHSSF